jgi:hypothetical protein
MSKMDRGRYIFVLMLEVQRGLLELGRRRCEARRLLVERVKIEAGVATSQIEITSELLVPPHYQLLLLLGV